MKTSKIVILSIILICVTAIIWFGKNFAPGSYPYVEKYEFNVSEEELINEINKLKDSEPYLKVPDNYGLVDGRKKSNDHWYHFYIFYTEEQEIINCWVRASSSTSTDLGFVSIINKYGKSKLLNKDFNNSESNEQKKKFEERFINKLKKLIDK